MNNNDIKVYLEPREYLDKAIVGIYDGRNVYSFDELISCYANHFLKNSIDGTMLTEDEAIDVAIDWVNYNTIPALPYFKEAGPIVARLAEDEFIDDEIEANLFLLNGQLWESLC